MVSKLTKAYSAAKSVLLQGDRNFCFRDCAFFPLCQKKKRRGCFRKAWKSSDPLPSFRM